MGIRLALSSRARKIADNALFRSDRYFNTFGGNAVSCACGLAVLDVLETEKLQDSAAEVGAYMRAALGQLRERHSVIDEIRGEGLFLGVQLTSHPDGGARSAFARDVMNDMAKRGVLVGLTGPERTLIKIRPPMVFTKAHADLLVGTMDQALSKAA